jgi:hypothetical protein
MMAKAAGGWRLGLVRGVRGLLKGTAVLGFRWVPPGDDGFSRSSLPPNSLSSSSFIDNARAGRRTGRALDRPPGIAPTAL